MSNFRLISAKIHTSYSNFVLANKDYGTIYLDISIKNNAIQQHLLNSH